MTEADALIGLSLGQYQIEELIGKGGMATVYKATQTTISRTVAIKVLPHAFMHDETFMQRFRREAEFIAKLEHFHILPIYDYGEYDGMPYIVMRFLEGGTLQDRIKEGPLPWGEVVRIVSQVAGALDYAHSRNVIHRDIKPSNIMLDAEDNAFLADFGIAKIAEGTAQLTGSGIVGTPAYMAPEQSNPGPPTPAMDVYALGVMLFEMITGQVPYMADTPIAQILMHIQYPVPSLIDYNPDMPPAVNQVIQQAMAKSPDDRYRSAGDLARALEVAASSVEGWSWSPDAQTHPAQTLQAVIPSKVDAATGRVPAKVEPAASGAARAVPRPRRGILMLGLGGLAGVILVGLVAVLVLAGRGSGNSGEEAAQTTTAQALAAVPLATSTPTLTATPTVAPTVNTPIPTVTIEPSATPAPTDLPATITLRGVPMVLIPAGRFIMGSDSGYPRERPAHEVYLGAYYIDTTEVTNLYYMACVEEGPCTVPLDDNSASIYRYYGTEPYYNYPVINISWDQAQTYCKWRGGHLPTEAQWEKAAGWDPATSQNRQFPWDSLVLGGHYLNYGSQKGDPVAVGTYPRGVSAYGLFEMAGNVAEWVYDWYQDNFYEHSPYENPIGPPTGEFKITRGGSYDDPGGQLTTTFRQPVGPATTDDRIGFRCAWTPSGDPSGE